MENFTQNNARKPFRARNAMLAGVLATLAIGTFVYTVARVKQDPFTDVKMTPELRKKLLKEREQNQAKTGQS
ncbi:hypothetical protein SJAG_04348 [Schizosaccharomyces japonicus yFS275]|uniref:Cytochrome c oxidase assembly factor 3 n=1 Tax=Schizosaccharomyces japonicus (strain yFS275 / FY16936) TaxID=402676 RepID=B6K6L3_SCHJY|nr:hypothetical protein SJAG_04348 [Schizosaccharomyces japonicus yFS275]EEB09167.1 hypothetical protein SJAG_04348 [Schizosaccharomyces japonicus yFS275]